MRLFVLSSIAVVMGCAKPTAVEVDGGANVDADAGEILDAGATTDAGSDAGVFEAVPYEVMLFDAGRISSDSSQPNFHRLQASLVFRDPPFSSVKLIADLGTTCYPFESWAQNRPPAGQTWPANCDAFDRNFEFTLNQPTDVGQPPAFELVRAITPFGGPMHLEVDLTDLANARPGTHRLQVEIPTWSDGAGKVTGSQGGWTVSARLEVVPGMAPRKVIAAIPLINRSTGPGPTPNVYFNIPAGVASARLEYRATGHGGGTPTALCIGPADEFCQRTHRLLVDGIEYQSFVPWRTDCQNNCTLMHYGSPGFDYCAQNPCGNINSVKAPRANWCPGTVTPPLIFDPPAFHQPGQHGFNVGIDAIGQGGSWRQSATLYLYGN